MKPLQLFLLLSSSLPRLPKISCLHLAAHWIAAKQTMLWRPRQLGPAGCKKVRSRLAMFGTSAYQSLALLRDRENDKTATTVWGTGVQAYSTVQQCHCHLWNRIVSLDHAQSHHPYKCPWHISTLPGTCRTMASDCLSCIHQHRQLWHKRWPTHPEMRQGAMAVTRSPNELPHGTTVLSRTKRDLRAAGPKQPGMVLVERVARAFDNFGAYSMSFWNYWPLGLPALPRRTPQFCSRKLTLALWQGVPRPLAVHEMEGLFGFGCVSSIKHWIRCIEYAGIPCRRDLCQQGGPQSMPEFRKHLIFFFIFKGWREQQPTI